MKRTRSGLSPAGAFLLLLLPASAPEAFAQVRPKAEAEPHEFVPGEILVKFVDWAPPGLRAAYREAFGAEQKREFPGIGVVHWRLGQGVRVEQALSVLAAPVPSRWIEYAEPNYIYQATQLPNDERRGELYGLHNLGQTAGGTPDADIDALEAWQATTGSPSIVVGVIDSGIDYNHPDLQGNIWTNPGEVAGNGLDDDGNGYVDDVRGWDFVGDDNDPMDDYSHGTHVAGTIGAIGNNGIGVAGVAWSVSLMPLKFLNSGGTGTTSDAILAIQYAQGKGVKITNNSWGGGPNSQSLKNAIAASGALFVAAAGNSGSSTKQYPAGFDPANILSVAATTAADTLASFSNFSTTWVDLAAPGNAVLSTLPSGGYGLNSGTSMAAPHASGVAALLLAQSPSLTIAGLKAQILNTVDVLPSLAGKTLTSGRLNAKSALGAADLPADGIAPADVADLAATDVQAHSVTLAFTAPGDDGVLGTAYLCDLRYVQGQPLTEANWASGTRALVPGPGSAGSIAMVTIGGLEPGGSYSFGVKSLDEVGNPSALSNVASATTPTGVPGWTVDIVQSGAVNDYIGLDYDPAGNPAVAYRDGVLGVAKFAHWNGSSWDIETVVAGGLGISLAYDPSGNPSLTHVSGGKLFFVVKTGSTWTSTTIETKNVQGDVTSHAYDSAGNPCVAYRLFGGSGGLKFARRVGTTWVKEMADAGAGARYSSLAFDAAGNPAIAYSEDIDGNGFLDTAMLARKQGSTWTAQVVDTGPQGYGVHAAVAFDPLTGNPSVAHEGSTHPRFLRWNGSAWVLETPELTNDYTFGCSLAYGSDGTAHLAYSLEEVMKVARRDPGGTWTIEPIDAAFVLPFHVRCRVGPDGRPGVAYANLIDGDARLSRRDTP